MKTADANLPHPGRRPRLGRLGWALLAVFVVALGLRLLVVREIFLQNPPEAIDRFAGDSRQYVDLAKNLVEGGRFANDSPQARPGGRTYFALLRPPVYPAFLAGFYQLEDWGLLDARKGILITQAILSALVPVIIVWVSSVVPKWGHAAYLAGAIGTFSATAIGLPGLLLADLPFAFCFALAFALLCVATTSSRASFYYLSGAAFGIASLVKPAGLYWVVVLPLVAWCLAHAVGQRVQWRHLLGAIAVCLAVLFGWAGRNYARVGLFTISTVDAQNLRYYLAPQVEEWVRAGGVPDKGPLKRHRERVMDRDEADIFTLEPAAIVRRQWAESVATFKAHPLVTLRAYAYNVRNHLATPFNHFHYEMPQGGRLRESLERADAIATSTPVFWTSVVLVFSAVVLPFAARTRDDSWRRRYFTTLAVLVTYGYLIVFSGTTYATGSRIVFPAQFALAILCAAGVVSIAQDVPSRFRRASSHAREGEAPAEPGA